MITNDNEALKRLYSPGNLMNKISGNRNAAMSLFGIGSGVGAGERIQPVVPPLAVITAESDPFEFARSLANSPEAKEETSLTDAVMDNAEARIKLSLVHDDALKVLHKAINQMGNNLDNIAPERLASVITATSKTVEGIRRERNQALKENKTVNIIFYTPTQKTVDQYEVIDV